MSRQVNLFLNCFFVLFLFSSCSSGVKVSKTDKLKQKNEGEQVIPDSVVDYYDAAPRQQDGLGSSGPVAVAAEYQSNPFLDDPSSFDLEHEKAMEFIGIVVNGTQTTEKDGGFYNSTVQSNTGGQEGSYTVKEWKDNDSSTNGNKSNTCDTAFSSSGTELTNCKGKDVYGYEYNGYKASTDSKVSITGSLTGVKDYPADKQIMVVGSLQIALNHNNSNSNPPGSTIYVYFGDSDQRKDSGKVVVFNENNVAQKGIIEISYTKSGSDNKKKEYNLTQLNESQRKELAALGLFKTKAPSQVVAE